MVIAVPTGVPASWVQDLSQSASSIQAEAIGMGGAGGDIGIAGTAAGAIAKTLGSARLQKRRVEPPRLPVDRQLEPLAPLT